MKIFPFFLPQFHTIPENDEWWGKDFTEWVNVKAARPLYKGHIQPRHPLNNYYYNLLDKDTVIWQTNLLNEYHIDGLIYYHYYFKGKKLLEKPAENLLNWSDINQRFFFCWANHSWLKTWNGTKEVLMPMEYGNEVDWEEHFQYLLPFFIDERYEKKDNMPIFMIFESNDRVLEDILEYFNQRCIDSGFNGLYVIETVFLVSDLKASRFSQTKAIHLREPSYSRSLYTKKIKFYPEHAYRFIQKRLVKAKLSNKPQVYDNNKLFDLKIEKEPMNSNYIHGVSFEWDNTPRHKGRGYVINPVSKERFMKYMDMIKEEEYLFIDAWNEWCEGMVLEPTEEDGYKYLEWIKEWVTEKHT